MPGQNLLGPFGPGVNETYVEPDFGDSAGSQFSWFLDCSDDVTPDGTRFTARWANRMMLVLRRAVVGMGIPLNETNGNSLLDAIMRAHRPIVNIGGGAAVHKGEKMPEWQHELRSLVGAGTVTVNVVGDTIVITGGAGSSVTLQSLGTGVPIYKGIAGSVHQFRSIMAEAGVAVEASANHATFRLAPIPGWSLLMRNGASADVPAGVAVDELTEQVSPSLNDWLMLQRNPGRELRKVKVEKIRGKGLVGQGVSDLGADLAPSLTGSYVNVMSGTIPASALGSSTTAFSATVRVEFGGEEPASAFRGHLNLQADKGSGFVDVDAEFEVEMLPSTDLRIIVPIVGHVLDAAGAVSWRLRAKTSTPGFLIRAGSRVSWLQFG